MICKRILLVFAVCFMILIPNQKSEAYIVERVIEKTANGISKLIYYTTKYTLKTGFLLTKYAAKGTWWTTKKTCTGIKNIATKSNQDKIPQKLEELDYDNTLPPVPENLPDINYW